MTNGGWLTQENARENRDIDFGTFWPKIGTKRFYDEYRPPAELPDATVVGHLKLAGIKVRRELSAWRARQTALMLAGIEQERVDAELELVLLFERAVYCEAKAEILKETLTADRRKEAENNAKSGDETEEKYREFAADAISLIVGESRVYVGDI